ncbi:unnamed protein product [Brassica rapa]|uniref:Uncharacterized protein n=1 Tax=Brassica campestris TaxID=3711 RepID=A0A3P5ZUQ3_BRACM|nr:unnamed protein product [Brassica rapa]VDC84506.1 unnamed protein product [Brassica rapa]
MLLAAQSMAIGTVMVRWVSKYSDPDMATGWHMVIGGLPLLAISVINHDPEACLNSAHSTFLTPMFASIFRYLYLDETFSSLQLLGAAVTLVAIYLVNFPEGND